MATLLEKANQILAQKEANLLPENLKSGVTCMGVEGTVIELQGEEKVIEPSIEQQIITPSEGKNGITQATVNPVTSAIDVNILPENIKAGVTILEVEGTYEGSGGGANNAEIGTYTGGNIQSAIVSIQNINTSELTNMNNAFSLCRNLISIPEMDTTGVTSMAGAFNECNSITTLPNINTANVTTMNNMCINCNSLVEIPELNTSSLIYMASIFNGCTSLVSVPVLNTVNVTSMSNAFSNCPNLSDESLNNILSMCITATGVTTKTLKSIGLNSEQANKCSTLENYSAFLEAGWTVGEYDTSTNTPGDNGDNGGVELPDDSEL